KMTGQVRLEDRRVYVALPAYGSGVAEPRGHEVDGLDDAFTPDPLAACRPGVGKRPRREDGPSPGAEILRRHILARDLAQTLAPVLRPARPALTPIAATLEET